MLTIEKYNLIEYPHCNGYGSNPKKKIERCPLCSGTGLVLKEIAEEYKAKEVV